MEASAQQLDGDDHGEDNVGYKYGAIDRQRSLFSKKKGTTSTSVASYVSLLSLDDNEPITGGGIVSESYLVPLRDEQHSNADNEYAREDESTVVSITESELTFASYASEASLSSLVSAWLPQIQHDSNQYTTLPTPLPANDRINDISFSSQRTTVAAVPFYLRLLGFRVNPLSDSPDLRLAMLSNLATSFNVVNVSIAIQIMLSSNLYGEEKTASTQSICSSALIAGMMLGQLLGGAIGDAVGRHLAMTLVMLLQIVASIGSAASFSTTSGLSIFQMLAIWRFILGVGCGGVYPLAATLTAESTTEKQSRGKLVALTFSMQGVGYTSVPIISLILISVLGEYNDLTWRLLLSIGALPGIVQMALRLRRRRIVVANAQGEHVHATDQDSLLQENEKDQGPTGPIAKTSFISLLHSMRKEKDIARKLCGTALTWFLFDVLFYGNVLFQRVVLIAAFGSTETIYATVLDTLMISSVALPGYFVSVARIGERASPRHVQLQGFAVMAVLYAIIGIFFEELSKTKVLLLFLYGSTFFFSNYGPNSTTFMLPSMTFSANCRSTLNGISAASGKAGALLGAMLFEPLSRHLGDPAVMMICACISLLGLYLTFTYVSKTVGQKSYTIKNDTSISMQHEKAKKYPMATPKISHRKKKKVKKKQPKLKRKFSAPSLLDFWR